MPAGAFVFNFFVQLLFSAFLLLIGYKFFSIISYQKHLTEYKKHPEKFGWFEHYFLGWSFFNMWFTEGSIKMFGDKGLTLMWRAGGAVLMAFGFFGCLGSLVWLVRVLVG